MILYTPQLGGGQVTPSNSVLEQFNIINSINTTGNYTNLDDVLGYLGTLNMYWWKRRSVGQYQAVVSSSYSTATIISGSSSYYIYVADSVTASSSGVTLNTPTSSFVNWTPNNDDIIRTIRNKYWYSSAYSNNIYYSCNGYIQSSGYQRTTQSYSVTSQLVVGDWEYVQSTSPSAYPQSGEQDGYEYVFLGQPFQNITEIIETGRYVGTGGYGTSLPNSVVFNRNHGLFLVMQETITSGTLVGIYIAGNQWMTGNLGAGQNVQNICTYSNLTLTWYNTTNAQQQFNQSNITYNYVAI